MFVKGKCLARVGCIFKSINQRDRLFTHSVWCYMTMLSSNLKLNWFYLHHPSKIQLPQKIIFVYSKSLLLLHLYKGNKVWTMWFSYKFPSIWRKFPFIPWKSLSRKSTLLLYLSPFGAFSFFSCFFCLQWKRC